MSAPDFDFEKWLEENQSCVSGFLVGEYSEDKVRELYALLRPRWIPCSEREPIIGARVLFKIKHDDEPVIGWRMELFWQTDCNNHAFASGWDSCLNSHETEIRNVTHWMPITLPELPKGEA